VRLRVRCESSANVSREATDDLLEELYSQIDTVTERVSVHELEVSLIGSYGPSAMQRELESRVRAWGAARRIPGGVHVEIGH
jgi:hypothetical protein